MQQSKLKTALNVIVFALIGAAILYFMWQSQGEAYKAECALNGTAPEDCSLLDKLVSDYPVSYTHLTLPTIYSV